MRYHELIENTDDDMFSSSSELAKTAAASIKQLEEPYQRTVRLVRQIARQQFGVPTRVSGVAKTSPKTTATFWFSTDKYRAGHPPRVVHDIKAELESRGFECRFTDSGWLSVRVPPVYSGQLDETDNASDDELFGESLWVIIQRLVKEFINRMPQNPKYDEQDVQDMKQVYSAFQKDIVHGFRVLRSKYDRDLDVAFSYFASSQGYNIDALARKAGVDLGDELNESTDADDELFGQRWYERVNRRSIELDGIDRRDYPDFSDAHVSYAEFDDGAPLTDEQLDQLTDMLIDSGELNQMAHDSLYENAEDDDDLFATPKIKFFDHFNEHDEDQLQAMGFQYGEHPEQDIDILNDYIDGWKDYRVVGLTGGEHDLVLHLDTLPGKNRI